jgi:hypothetical protein
MKSLGRFPNLLMNVSTLGFVWIDLAIVLIARQTMLELLFIVFIALCILLMLVDK